MATGHLALGQEQGESSANQRIVNDFSIIVATVNGSGSQSANSVLLKSIFGMGIPVSGKNLFPSNIAGLPTWYTIRASKDGYVARKREIDVLVALNPETARDDMMAVQPDGAAIYEESLNLKQYRDDVVCYPVPFDKITQSHLPRSQAAQAGEEHGVRGRGGATAGDRPGRWWRAGCASSFPRSRRSST